MNGGEQVKLKKKDVNKVNEFDSTPLQAAVHSNDINRVKTILELNADPNITEKPTQETALHRAVLNRNPDIVKILIDAKANIEAVGRYGTALHLAANRNTEILNYLIQSNADIHFLNQDGVTPLFVAAMSKKGDNLKALVHAKADLNSQNSEGNSLLHYAASKHKFAVLEFLLDNNVNPNLQNEKGHTVLHEVRESFVVKMLIEHKADVNIQDAKGNTPVHSSVNGVWAVTKELLDHKPNLSIRNKAQNTPLLEAACSSPARLIEMFNACKIDLLSSPGKELMEEIKSHPTAPAASKNWIEKEFQRQSGTES